MKAALRRKLPILLVLLCGLWGVPWKYVAVSSSWNQNLRSHDADTHYLVDGWDEAPRFADTLRWWHGSWGAKHRPFYRPISSTLFWTQYQLFGVNGRAQFQILLVVWHFVALLMVWRFLSYLLGHRDGTLIACLWGAQLGDVFHTMSAVDALCFWKDNVESWHAIPNLLCLLFFTRYLREGAPSGRGVKFLTLSLLFFLIAICVKELAYTVPFVLLLLLWHEKKMSTHWRAVLPFFGLAGAMFCFRFWALGGMGFRMGSNERWPFRLLNDNLGAVFTRIINRDWLIPSVFALVLALFFLKRRRWIAGAVGIVGATALFAGTVYFSDLTAESTALRLLVGLEWLAAPLLALQLLIWWRTFTQRPAAHCLSQRGTRSRTGFRGSGLWR